MGLDPEGRVAFKPGGRRSLPCCHAGARLGFNAALGMLGFETVRRDEVDGARFWVGRLGGD